MQKIFETIKISLKELSKVWNGKEAIIEMKNADYPHWRQMEWIGFYFQYLCEKTLKNDFEFQKPVYNNVSFDGLYKNSIPFDFKAHAINTSAHNVIVNDSNAVSAAIKDYGFVGVIIALGEVQYNDKDRTFQGWHENLKGGLSDYSKERIKRGAWSRLRKCRFDLKQISIIKITDKTLIQCGSFQENFRNSNGIPRRRKILIDLEKIEEDLVDIIEF